MNKVTMYSLTSRGEEFFQTIDMIDAFRQELAAFDESLQEVQNILTGYKEAVMPEPEPAPEEEYGEEYVYETDEVEDEEG